MIHEISLENFKAFGSEQKIPLRPITLIYGPNSSGKSTIFNALLMLKQTYEQSLGVETSLLYKGSFTDQQNFSRCVNGREVNKEFKIGVSHRSKQRDWVHVVYEPYQYVHAGYEPLQEIDTPHEIGIFRDLDGKAYLTLEEIDTFRHVRGYRWIDGKTILDSIEYSTGNLSFCTLKWIGNNAVQGDDVDILSTPYPPHCPCPPEEDPLLKPYIDRIPDEYLYDQGFVPLFSTLREEIEFRMREDSTLPDDALEYHPYNIDVESISEELLVFVYEFLMREVERHCENVEYSFKDFKKDILYNIKQTVIFTKHGNPYYYGHLDGGIFNRPRVKRLSWLYSNKELSKIYDFVTDTIIDQTPKHKSLFKDLNYVGPLRKFPERFTDVAKDSYSSVGNDGERTSAILYENPEILNGINSALAKLGLNYELAIHSLKREDLEAFGDIYSLQVIEKSTETPLTLCDVGFGLGQVLPILVQSTLFSSGTVLIEQPEIHLHPKMQTELGDFFIEQCGLEGKRSIEKEEWDLFGKQFVIETHSEHLLLRIMRRIRETAAGTLKDTSLALTPEDVAILYVKPSDEGSQILHLRIDDEGDFIDEWPGGFFEESFEEKFAGR